MNAYEVWDPSSEEQVGAERFEACSAEHAAEIYASDDVDGTNDGTYSGAGHVLHVRCVDEDGKPVKRIRVTVDYDPTYTAEEEAE